MIAELDRRELEKPVPIRSAKVRVFILVVVANQDGAERGGASRFRQPSVIGIFIGFSLWIVGLVRLLGHDKSVM